MAILAVFEAKGRITLTSGRTARPRGPDQPDPDGGGLRGPGITAVPEGVTALVGWANRLLVMAYCAWVMTTAWYLALVRHPRTKNCAET